MGGRLSGTLPRGLGCHWDVTLAVYSTGHSSGLPAEEDSERRFSAQPLVADFENVSGVGGYGNDGSEGGGEERVSVLALSDTLERRVSPCHCVTENYVVMSELRHALNDTSLARRMTQESWSQDAPSGSRFALGLPLPRLSSPLSLSRSSSLFIP